MAGSITDIAIAPPVQNGITGNNHSNELLRNSDYGEKNKLFRKGIIQPKLTVGAPDNLYEKEADAIADKVMRMPEQNFVQRKCTECEKEEKLQRQVEKDELPVQAKHINGQSFVQKKCAACEKEEEEKLHRKPISEGITPFIQTKSNGESTASDSLTSSIQNSRGGGVSLDSTTQSFMESRFGADFSSVKIHTGGEAIQLNKELNAQAFTVGSDVYFNEGKYQPASSEGKQLLAHELTHVIQQNNKTQGLIQMHGLVEGWIAELELRKKKIKSFVKHGNASIAPFGDASTGVLSGYQLIQNFKLELATDADPDKYSFVQLIKGELYVDRGGTKEYWPASMGIYGKKATDPFLFTDWIVDTPDVDPRFGSHNGVKPKVPTTEFEDAPAVILKGDKPVLPPGLTYKIEARMGVYPWGWPIPASIGDWEKMKPTPFVEINWGWKIVVSKDSKSLDVDVK